MNDYSKKNTPEIISEIVEENVPIIGKMSFQVCLGCRALLYFDSFLTGSSKLINNSGQSQLFLRSLLYYHSVIINNQHTIGPHSHRASHPDSVSICPGHQNILFLLLIVMMRDVSSTVCDVVEERRTVYSVWPLVKY